jgi:hypothetical protein
MPNDVFGEKRLLFIIRIGVSIVSGRTPSAPSSLMMFKHDWLKKHSTDDRRTEPIAEHSINKFGIEKRSTGGRKAGYK